MSRTYSYSYVDAVKILGGQNHPVVAAMDKVLGGALLVGSLGLGQVLDLFDAKPDFARLFSELVTKVSEKRRGLNRYDRTQRLYAAHSVVVMTAYFEALRELELPFSFSADDENLLDSGNPFDKPLPMPSAGLSHEANLVSIRTFYEALNQDLEWVTTGSATWDRLTAAEQERTFASYRVLPDRAVRRYQELFRQLAVDCPEVAFWSSMEDHRATRLALARLEDVLREMTAVRVEDVRLTELAAVYSAALRRPLVPSGGGSRIPALGEAYVDPRFQLLVDSGRETVPATAEYWSDMPERTDLYAYLAGRLTSVEAWFAPLLVLGDPGSGKSVLTEMMAARLSAAGTPVVRVELRNVPADSDVRQQIEHGLQRLLDEPVGWAAFSRATGGSVPVVVLDGLDELMQATGVSQNRYLTAVAELQQDLADKRRPAAFVVTSRLSVCAGLALPAMSHVVRLLPFSEDQVRQWLEVWNAGGSPLPAEVALEYPELAEQPLLLLMLALYDAVDGALRRDHQQISRGQLYERLLGRFARREVEKSPVERTEEDLDSDVEFELDRLSVVALAMFNRGVQWVTGDQVTADLAALLEVGSADRSVGARTPLSSGDLALGRFFFVQKTEAVRGDDTKLATYEFLHATFGEYLVARFIWRTLTELAREDAARSRRKTTVDDTELYAVLSFMALTTSKPLLDFLREFADDDRMFDMLVRLLETRDDRRVARSAYEPVPLPDSAREAKYAANLVALTLVLRDRVYAPDLRFSVDDWRRATLFWKSRLSAAEWASFVRCVWMTRDREQHFYLSLHKGAGAEADPGWLLMSEPYVTLDEVSLTWRDAMRPLTSAYSIDDAITLVELAATPVSRCVPVLRRLVDDSLRHREACARIGVGGDDLAILSAFAEEWDYGSVPVLEAWLRLHERGFRFPAGRAYLSTEELLPVVSGHGLAERPDLVKRAKAAAVDLGLVWPPTVNRRSRSGPDR
ncbi:NACHT domain-containing protein [Lentzea sp. NEAU-D7]|uniref:NACHT domain-containing protein n=1 Tax=Lentzea sp. NEAU-D7 TaxID=2994667 RepID=UPI00224B9246|nr:ATP-binding protein [Lentzea sp. NEAU-D7]MCX2950350.1 ATP-binding protein [Lentzea sp. NEAU-D7]